MCFQLRPVLYLISKVIFQTLDNGMNVVQLETAVGAAIKSFDRAVGKDRAVHFFTNEKVEFIFKVVMVIVIVYCYSYCYSAVAVTKSFA